MGHPSVSRFVGDQSGATVIIVALFLAVLLGFAGLAIDVGTLALTRTQLQNAADSGALAGASVLCSSGRQDLARAEARAFTAYNRALLGTGGMGNQLAPVTTTDADVTFPAAQHIRVVTHRTTATADPVRSYFMRVIDPAAALMDMRARAAATCFWVCDNGCLKPWSTPDRWTDTDGDGGYDAGEPYDPIATGYNDSDIGTFITLKLMNGNDSDFGEFWYYCVDYPPLWDDSAGTWGNPVSGASRYAQWIAGCPDPTVMVGPDDFLVVEPGNMVGPTKSSVQALIDRDPGAYWDPASLSVKGSAFTTSPRVVVATFFDPSLGLRDDLSGRKYLTVVKPMVFFLAGVNSSSEVTGYFMRHGQPGGEACADQSNPTFLYRLALVE